MARKQKKEYYVDIKGTASFTAGMIVMAYSAEEAMAAVDNCDESDIIDERIESILDYHHVDAKENR